MADKRLIKKRYISMSAVLIGLSILLLLLPKRYSSSELKPEKLLLEIIDRNNFVTTDYVADRIINSDPFILLIDLRTPEEFAKFSLPGAINIPLGNLLDKDEKGKYKSEFYLNQDIKKNIFYSNGSIYANQAWMITRRLNYKNNYVMEGGLNNWVETILLPQKPKPEASPEEFSVYGFRKAASLFFGGKNSTTVNEIENIKPLPTVKKKNNQEKEEEGGC